MTTVLGCLAGRAPGRWGILIWHGQLYLGHVLPAPAAELGRCLQRAAKGRRLPSNRYGRIFKGKTAATFPYALSKLAPLNPPAYESMCTSPFGNSLLTDPALAALQSTDLGLYGVPYLLAISYSGPDAVGHTFGPLSEAFRRASATRPIPAPTLHPQPLCS